MTRFTGWAAMAGLMLVATAANAQMLAPYRGVSDLDGPYETPYGAMPPAPPPAYTPPPVYNYGGGYGAYRDDYGAALLPPREVYAVLRDNGFSPLGIPHQRGLVYIIAAMDRRGEDGRLVIDARTGRILRFMPAYGYGYDNGGPDPYGDNFGADQMSAPVPGVAVPPPTVIRGIPRPPAPIPHAASRAAPRPSVAAKPAEPARQQSATIESKPATPPAPAVSAESAQANALTSAKANVPPPSTTVGEAKPAQMVRPTLPMPPAQGLD